MVGNGWQLRGYRAASRLIPLAAPMILKRRLARGKEDADRWREKQGVASAPHPDGPLVWMHAVGLGEVLALRGLIEAMLDEQDDLSFLVTSSARSSAQGLSRMMPARTVHQYLPLDAPSYLGRFLDHWAPNLSIWAEQDVWPNAVCMAAERGVPLAMVNARMGAQAYARRARAAGLYADVLSRFAVISAQDEGSRANLLALGANAVQVDGPLKAAGVDLPVDETELARLEGLKGGRALWLLASSHAADEAALIGALGEARVIVAPRDLSRAKEIAEAFRARGCSVGLRSENAELDAVDVYVADTFGEMGLWYRLADVALIGGTFDETEGHNPWEAAALGCPILHGPRIANFGADYMMLAAAEAARDVTPETLASALNADGADMAARARKLVEGSRAGLAPLAASLCDMVAA